jgi:predicted AAA+ superfamily ATPase
MLPMSLYETGESNGAISLTELFANPELNIEGIQSEITVEGLIYAVCRGGWPATYKCRTDKARLRIAYNALKSTCDRDISQFDGVKRKSEIAMAILKSYARNISSLAKKTTMIEDVKGMLGSMTEPTFDDYAEVLHKLYVLDDIYGWCPSIRSASGMRSGPKREFVDPSIAIAALGLSPDSFQYDLKTFGFFFENLCVRDLRAYTQGEDAQISYYHDRNGLEADIVLHLKDGRYALIECKLGSSEIEDGAGHLVKLRRLIKENNEGENQVPLREPDLLIVLTGGNIAYTRADGVKVIPLSCLKW